MANQKMLAPNTKVVFVPLSGVANPSVGPTLSEVNAGTDISCAIVAGYTLNATDPDTDDSASICDAGNVVNQTYDNYELDMTFFRDNSLTNSTVYNAAYALFSGGPVEGLFVRRVGKLSSVAMASNDKVDFFGHVTDYVRTKDDRKAPVQFQIKGIPDGYIGTNFALA